MLSRDHPDIAATGKWLSVVGIGADGIEGLGAEAKKLISDAAVVFGGKRHLAMAAGLVSGEARSWPSPFDDAMDAVRALRGRAVCVLASGDPFLHGVGATLTRHLPISEMTVIPSSSAFSLAAAALGWPLQDVHTISLHGKPVDLIRPLLHPGRKIIALTSDEKGPAHVAGLLANAGFGDSRFTLLEALGGPDEHVTHSLAETFSPERVNPLNVIAIEVIANAGARILPLATGLADDLFEHDGQITKREIRAMTLSALSPRRGELLWDIGAGSGSISIEWLLADPSMRAIAIEVDSARAARIRRNAMTFGVPSLHIVEGRAPDALRGLAMPDAIFVGGGSSGEGVMALAIDALRPGGRLVVNAVTLETESLLTRLNERYGGELTRLSLARGAPVGTMRGWRPAMPVTQWSWVKP